MSYHLVVRRYAPFSSFGGGFEGDVRSAASSDPNATARTIGVVTFDTVSVEAYRGFSSGSTFEGLGQWVAKRIGRHYSQVKTTVDTQRSTLGHISFTIHVAGGNPLVPVVAPDIDTFVDFHARFVNGSLAVSGTIRGDAFPNAEVLLLDDMLQPLVLFDFHTSGGRQTGPLSLFGDGAGTTLGTFQAAIALSDGKFIAPNPTCSPTTQ